MCNDTTFSEAIRDEVNLSLDELARGRLPGVNRILEDAPKGSQAAGPTSAEASHCRWCVRFLGRLKGRPSADRRAALLGTQNRQRAGQASQAIESTFATVKARTRTTKGAGSRSAGLAMAFKLLTQAGARWRRVNSPRLVALVHAGVKFPDGKTRILPDLPPEAVVNEPVNATSEVAIHSI